MQMTEAEFPHYMWGCIDWRWNLWKKKDVPSLYVRVYRVVGEHYIRTDCSLIICEGVSYTVQEVSSLLTFPHYMWGCITQQQTIWHQKRVPSLYVRVYRPSAFKKSDFYCSLIICEGVSMDGGELSRRNMFPHYMWGCIMLISSY